MKSQYSFTAPTLVLEKVRSGKSATGPLMHKLRPARPAAAGQGQARSETAGLISTGVVTSIATVPFHGHGVAPLSRRVFAGDGLHEELGLRVVAHELVGVGAASRSYCELHVHDCAELNLLLSTSRLVYEIRLGDDVYEVEAPASIYIPAGLRHSANVISGTGFFVAMIDTSDYQAATREQPGVTTRNGAP